MREPESVSLNDAVLREVTDFGLGKLATVSTNIGGNRWLVLSEPITHADFERVEWSRMIGEMFAGGNVVEAQ
jgi:hypothetical protein